MGVKILQGDQPYDGACLYCSVTDWAFGPVFEDAFAAQEFLDWLGTDPRRFDEFELRNKYHDWLDEKEEQRKQEQEETETATNQSP